MSGKEIFGFLSVLLTLLAFLPYIFSTIKNHTRPHLFTWIVWGFTAGISSAAQYSDNAGEGAWAAMVGAFFCFSIAVLAVRHGEKSITRSDWISFFGALAAIPLWYVTKNALSAAIMVAAADALGFYPTFRKSYTKPHEELAFKYIIEAIRFLLACFAIENYSLTTLLYPLYVILSNTSFVLMLLWRRHRLRGIK